MSKILIISATKGTNFILANNIKRNINIKNEIVVLEDYEMPLYLPNLKNIDKALIYELGQKFKHADGLIFVHQNIMEVPTYTHKCYYMVISYYR